MSESYACLSAPELYTHVSVSQGCITSSDSWDFLPFSIAWWEIRRLTKIGLLWHSNNHILEVGESLKSQPIVYLVTRRVMQSWQTTLGPPDIRFLPLVSQSVPAEASRDCTRCRAELHLVHYLCGPIMPWPDYSYKGSPVYGTHQLTSKSPPSPP